MTICVSKLLRKGKMHLNTVLNQIEINGEKLISIPYLDIAPDDWGKVYEKYVGQILETEGYKVWYRGLELGFYDKGIDLITENEANVLFVQCKYQIKKIAKNHIEWILYKASKELLNQHDKFNKKITFLLVFNNKDQNFSARKNKLYKADTSHSNGLVYPVLDYFLSKNHTQDKVKVDFREIEMVI